MNADTAVCAVGDHHHFLVFLLGVAEGNVTSLEPSPILCLRIYSGSVARGSRAVSPCSGLIVKSLPFSGISY